MEKDEIIGLIIVIVIISFLALWSIGHSNRNYYPSDYEPDICEMYGC